MKIFSYKFYLYHSMFGIIIKLMTPCHIPHSICVHKERSRSSNGNTSLTFLVVFFQIVDKNTEKSRSERVKGWIGILFQSLVFKSDLNRSLEAIVHVFTSKSFQIMAKLYSKLSWYKSRCGKCTFSIGPSQNLVLSSRWSMYLLSLDLT